MYHTTQWHSGWPQRTPYDMAGYITYIHTSIVGHLLATYSINFTELVQESPLPVYGENDATLIIIDHRTGFVQAVLNIRPTFIKFLFPV